MILKSQIREYMQRPLRDLSVMKRWSLRKIDRKLAELDPLPVFITTPRRHQKICFYIIAKLPHDLQLLDMGLGKTKLVLDAFRWFKTAGRMRRLLVLVPAVINLEAWRDEIKKHAPDLMASYIEGTPAERERALNDSTDICIATYSGLSHLVCTRAMRDDKTKMTIDKKKLATLRKRFDGVIWDECNALMNHRSLNFKIANQLAKNYVMRIGLTGTPLGRDPQVLWPQYFAVDRGEALGETLGMFRQAFFRAKPKFWGGTDYQFRAKLTGKLHKMMAHSAITYSSAECLDLPKAVDVKRPVRMTDEQWSYYHAVLEKAQEARGLKMIDLEGVFVRLRQITSGFVSVDRKPSPLAANPKLDGLMELVDELPKNEKVVIFHDFIFSGDQISQALAARKIKCARLYSKVRNKAAELRKFNGDPKCRAFVVNSASGAQGLNLQVARFVMYYEYPVPVRIYQQSRRRCLRQGQERTVFLYGMFCRHTVDEKIMQFLAEGRDLFRAVVEGGVNVLQTR
jgi:SNF2 family DNA or RNA helicase